MTEDTQPKPGAQVITPEQLAAIMEKHFQAVAVGLAACNPMVPPDIMWSCIATAMGRVLSAATQGPDIQTTFASRDNACRIVSDAIKKAYPSFNARNVYMMQVANQNGVLRQ